jgi:hypothetical protein
MARRISSLVLAGLWIVAWSFSAQAQTTHPLHPFYSNTRAQIGDGLPIPITILPPPSGPVHPVNGGTVMQGTVTTTAGVPKALTLPANVFTYNLGVPKNIGAKANNPNVFQVQTTLGFSFPMSTVMFVANGRTGPDTVTWCPGFPLPVNTPGGNPSCTNPSVTTPINPPVNSSVRYVRTANNLGGVGQARVRGFGMSVAGGTNRGAVVAVRAGANQAPCVLLPLGNCRVAFDTVPPAATGAGGAAFGFTNMTPGIPPVKPGVFNVSANSKGTITYITTPGLNVNGFTNKATSWGAPWTAGMLTVRANTAAGAPELFVLSGSDVDLVSTQRKVSLVAGAMSQRTTSKPNANRGWLNLYIPEPGAVAGAVGALLALFACHQLVRRRSR